MAERTLRITLLVGFGFALAAWPAACSAPPAEGEAELTESAQRVVSPCAADLQGVGDIGAGWLGLRTDGSTWLGSPGMFVPTLGLGVKALADVDGESLAHCAVKTDDSLWCWGNNANGQLGDGTQNDAPLPRQVAALGTSVRQAVISQFFGCALRNDGGVSCWGDNAFGELGDGTYVDHLTPAPVPTLGSGVKAVSAGFDHACALKTDGTLWCWGGDLYGQVGAGQFAPAGRPTPVQVFDRVEKVSAGGFFTCAIRDDDTLWCWGGNADGHLGVGSTASMPSPQAVTTLGADVRDVDTAVRSACAVKLDGSVWCWGYRGHGRLGDGIADASKQLTPARVSGPLGTSGGKTVRVVEGSGCVIGVNGLVSCWGGSPGLDGTPPSTVPVPVDMCAMPRMSAIAPATGWEGGGPTVTITGADFVAGAQVRFDGVPATSVTVDSATTMRVVPPPHYPDVVDVTLTLPGGLKAEIKNGFTYLAPPSAYGIAPTSGPTAGGTAVTLSGSQFRPNAAVTFGGAASPSVTVNSPNQITALAPAHAPGAVPVKVTNPDGQSVTLAVNFTFIGSAGAGGAGGGGGAGATGGTGGAAPTGGAGGASGATGASGTGNTGGAGGSGTAGEGGNGGASGAGEAGVSGASGAGEGGAGGVGASGGGDAGAAGEASGAGGRGEMPGIGGRSGIGGPSGAGAGEMAGSTGATSTDDESSGGCTTQPAGVAGGSGWGLSLAGAALAALLSRRRRETA